MTQDLRCQLGEHFEHSAYQSEDMLVVEVKPIKEKTADSKEDPSDYTGERLSLNFQNIEVRAVLLLLADFTGLNLVTSDTVQGEITLRLKNVPWDQAMDIILKTKGLAMRQKGNIILVAPAVEIAAQERQELEAKKQLVELEPLRSELFSINYAKADQLAAILTGSQAASSSSESAVGSGFLSERGSIIVDKRTNSILVRDTESQLAEVRELIQSLDITVRQVLIKSRIVIANDDFAKDLGAKFGVSSNTRAGGQTQGRGTNSALSGTLTGARALNNGTRAAVNGNNDPNLNVNLPVTRAGAGSLALALAKMPFGRILELELSALQTEGKGEIISSPHVITSDQETATIKEGVEIPYQESSSSVCNLSSF